HWPYVPSGRAGQLGAARAAQGDVSPPDLAGVGLVEARQYVQQGALPRPGGPEHDGQLAGVDAEVDAAQHVHLGGRRAEAAMHPFTRQHARHAGTIRPGARKPRTERRVPLPVGGQMSAESVGAIKEQLAQVPLFHGVPERAIEIAASAVRKRVFEPGATIFQEGDKGEALYIMAKGLVKLSKVDLGGHEKTLAILQPPEFFGEMALLGQTTRSAT